MPVGQKGGSTYLRHRDLRILPVPQIGPRLQNRKGLIGGQCSKLDAVCTTKPTADIVSLSRQANFCTTPDQCLIVRQGPASPDCEDDLFLDSADQFAL